VTSPRPCGQRSHADVRRRAELAQHGSEVLRKAHGDTEPRLDLPRPFGQFCRLAPLRRRTRAHRAAQESPPASRQRHDDVVGINRAGLTFFRRDPGSVHIIISEVYLAPFRTAAFIQPRPVIQHHPGIGPAWLACKLLADLPQRAMSRTRLWCRQGRRHSVKTPKGSEPDGQFVAPVRPSRSEPNKCWRLAVLSPPATRPCGGIQAYPAPNR
jgi:hypothetical protein